MANIRRRVRRTRRSRKSRRQSGAGYSMDVGAATIGGLTAVRSYDDNLRPTLTDLNAGKAVAAQSGGAKRRTRRNKRRTVRKSRRSVRKSRKSVRKSRKSVRKSRRSVRKSRRTRRNRRNGRK